MVTPSCECRQMLRIAKRKHMLLEYLELAGRSTTLVSSHQLSQSYLKCHFCFVITGNYFYVWLGSCFFVNSYSGVQFILRFSVGASLNPLKLYLSPPRPEANLRSLRWSCFWGAWLDLACAVLRRRCWVAMAPEPAKTPGPPCPIELVDNSSFVFEVQS